MFHHRSTEFDPRVSTIAGHLRAIEKELGGLEKKRRPACFRQRGYSCEPNYRRDRPDFE